MTDGQLARDIGWGAPLRRAAKGRLTVRWSTRTSREGDPSNRTAPVQRLTEYLKGGSSSRTAPVQRSMQ
jgi:hypothetical protein